MRCDRRTAAVRRLPAAALALALAVAAAAALAAPAPKASKTAAPRKMKPAAAPARPQVPPESLLAVIGERTISMADLDREWKQLAPSMRPQESSPLAARQMLLEDLVTRNLLGLEAERHPRPMTDEQTAEYAQYRETMMKNRLYTIEVIEGIPLDDIDRGRFQMQMTTILFLRAFTFESRDAAQAWSTRIVGGTPLARLETLAGSGEPGAPVLVDLGYKIREEFADSVAAVLFALPVSRLSPPLPYRGKWALFQVTQTRPRPNATDWDDPEDLRGEYRRVAAAERREAYRAKLAEQMQIRYEYANADTLLNRFLLLRPRIETQADGPGNVNMNMPLPPTTEADLELRLATTLEGQVRARDVIAFLGEMMPSLRPDIRSREQLLPWVDRVAFDKELMRRAVARGLEQDPDVARDLALRREKYLVEALYADSVAGRVVVDDDSLRARFYADTTRYAIPEKATVWVCVTESEARADSVLKLARGGVDLEQLARDWSIAPNATAGGMSPSLTPGESQEPEVDRAIFATPVGGFAGPLATAQGYAVLKVLERSPRESRSFQQAYQDLVTEYRLGEEERQMVAFVARLRQRHPVETHSSKVADMRF